MSERHFWENFILTAIVLVIIHTFLSDIGVWLRWSLGARKLIIFSALFFDTLFTVEFVVRSVTAKKKQGLITYWLYQRGWVDFMSSVPLLILNSGLGVFLLLSPGHEEAFAAIGVLNILKIVKAIRVTRVLRLIRVMKIFGKIRNTESKMAQHHTSTISTTAVAIVLFVILIFTFAVGDPLGRVMEERKIYYEGLVDVIVDVIVDVEATESEDDRLIHSILVADELTLRLSNDDTTLFSKVPIERWDKTLFYEDYVEVERRGYKLAVSVADINGKSALYNIRVFCVIIALVVGFMFFYTRHFVQTITDVLFIVNRGFRERGYTLQVKIPKEYQDHEIFELARFYNNRYLPAKLKRIHQSKLKKESKLSMKDLFKFKSN